MKVYDAAGIRNIACVGHSGAGKTQLVSAMLFDAGTVNRLGKVDEGTTVTDFDDEEIARKHTLCSSPAFAEWNKIKINLIDTPGVANFISDTRAAMRVVDATLFVVDAVAGVEVQTEAIWKIAQEQNLPRMVALNRFDRERANLARALESLRAAFGRTVVPLTLPIGEEKNFSGVIDLVSLRALTFAADGTGTMTAGEIPAAMRDNATAERDALIEMIAEADDALMERFFEEGTLSAEEMMMGLKRGVMSGRLFPLFCTSALQNIGVQPLLDAIVAYAPSPLERPFVAKKRRTGARERARAPARMARPRAPRRRWRTPAEYETDRRRGGRERAVHGVRVEDGGRSVRRTHHAVPRRLRLAALGHDGAQPVARHSRTARASADPTRQDDGPGPGDQSRGHRRGRQAEGNPIGRDLRRQEHGVRVPRAGVSRSRCSPTRSSRRAAATKTRSAPRSTACRKKIPPSITAATRRRRRRCSPVRASCTSR